MRMKMMARLEQQEKSFSQYYQNEQNQRYYEPKQHIKVLGNQKKG
jgi:hypothetical protein